LKKVRIVLWGLIVVAMVGIVVAKVISVVHRDTASKGNELFAVPDIRLTDQDRKPFSTDQLHGHPWICDFIFTSCPGSCPIMTHQMTELQKKTPSDVDLVSFTVDPEHDTPAILREYGQSVHADFSRWHFLTGSKKDMGDAAYAMKISVRPADKDFALTHSEHFLLVNQTGHVVGIYEGTNSEDVAKLITDAAKLSASNDGRKPT
jgi:protein SCO1/2